MNTHRMLVAGFFISGLMTLTAAPSAYSVEQEQIIIDDLSVPELRAQIDRIQTEFHRVFNSLNDDDEFDIECRKYTPTGSNISQLACEPLFVTKHRANNANDYRIGADELLSPDALLKELDAKLEQLTAKMNEQLRANDYFRELNQVLKMLRERLEELDQ